jgi:hypothetical protein
MAQIVVKGFRDNILRRTLCFNLLSHVLDVTRGCAVYDRLSDGRRPQSDGGDARASRRLRYPNRTNTQFAGKSRVV